MADGQLECVLTTWDADHAVLARIRREVFIQEQQVPESDEWDDDDAGSIHALARLNREPVGTGRLNPAGKIGRIAVIAGLRGRGIGALILRRLLEAARDHGIRETIPARSIAGRALLREARVLERGRCVRRGGHSSREDDARPGVTAVQTQRQSVTGTRSIIGTLDEARSATQQVAFAARRLLTMYTQDLEPAVYDQPQFLETVKKLVLAKSYAKVRVLLADPSRVVYEGSKFVHLARRITSHIEIRRVKSESRDNQSAFLIADDRALVYRLQASRWEGIVEMNDPLVARRYLNYFDEIWIASEPEAESRQQHL